MMMMNPIIAPINTDNLYALLSVVAEPARHKALLDAIVSERDAAKAEQAKLANLQSERDQIAKDRTAFEKERTSGLVELAARKSAAEAEGRQIEAAKEQHAASVQQLAADRAALDKSKREHEQALGQVSKLRAVLG
jgi:DNA repair photolyase